MTLKPETVPDGCARRRLGHFKEFVLSRILPGAFFFFNVVMIFGTGLR